MKRVVVVGLILVLLITILIAYGVWHQAYFAPFNVPVIAGGCTIEAEVVSDSPRVVVLRNFLTKLEAKTLISENDHHLERSKVLVDGPDDQITDYRTSSSTTLTSQRISQTILRRCIPFTHVPQSHFEPLQLVRYRPGEEFKVHSDCFSESAKVASQRFDTFFIYLNNLELDQGGCTVFPKLNLKFRPQLGTAIHWINVTTDGSPNQLLNHYGDKVNYGVKYSVNVWTRTKPYHGH